MVERHLAKVDTAVQFRSLAPNEYRIYMRFFFMLIIFLINIFLFYFVTKYIVSSLFLAHNHFMRRLTYANKINQSRETLDTL